MARKRQRFDNGIVRASTVRRTPQGGLRVKADITRTGIFEYYDSKLRKTIKEYRAPEEVFSKAAMDSLASATVTWRHPPRMVSPSNFKKYAVGNLHGEAKRRGKYVAAELFVQDSQGFKAIQKGEKEISCGYRCDVLDEGGVTPDGEKFDRRQVNIRYNHVAIVPRGRAGREVRLHLDADGHQTENKENTTKGKTMPKIRIDGVLHDTATEACVEAIGLQTTRLTNDAEEAKELAEEEKKKRETAEKKADELQKRVDELESPERLDQAVKAKTKLLESARMHLGKDAKLDGLSDSEILDAVITKFDPAYKLDAIDDNAKRAMVHAFGTVANKTKFDTNDVIQAATASSLGVADKNNVKTDSEENSHERKDTAAMEAAWKQPLAVSKQNLAN